MAAKRAASVRQNSATESADSIEIYVPEAQTRLWEQTSTDYQKKFKLTLEILLTQTQGAHKQVQWMHSSWSFIAAQLMTKDVGITRNQNNPE